MPKDIIKNYLIILFVVVELLSMIFNFYFININFANTEYKFNFSVIFFCIGFFIVDIIADNFSANEANRFIYYKLFSQVSFLILGNVAIFVYGLQGSQLAMILNKSPWVMAAGLLATYAGFYLMSSIMSYMKLGVYQGTSTFKRYLYSTIPGELLFSFVFSFLCFYKDNSFAIFVTSAVVKIILSIIFAAIMSLLINLKHLHQDTKNKWVDMQTN